MITTTRNQEVGTACCFPSQGYVYQMQPLNELHSRRLFFKRLFDTEDSCPEQFREISHDMLRKCKGVPLAITSIASLLANHMHVDIWEKIHNSLGSELYTNPTLEWMRHVLSLSYNDLSHELKTCLLYLGTYPEDYQIRKYELVRKWIAEGFVREKHGLDMQEAAVSCFNELINRSMIQPCFNEDDFGEVLTCQFHDLMLELIVSKCKEENFITIIDRKFTMNRANEASADHLVLQNQSAFIKGRSIHDNFRNVQLTCKAMHVKKAACVMLKVNIAKAFDTVAWSFLLEILQHMRFGQRWRNWISTILSTASTRILLNGHPGRRICHARDSAKGTHCRHCCSYLSWRSSTAYWSGWRRGATCRPSVVLLLLA